MLLPGGGINRRFTNRRQNCCGDGGFSDLRITVALPPSFGRGEAVSFRNQLLVAFDQKESVVIDCARTGALPALWVQLLCAAAASAQGKQLSIVLKNISAACRASFEGIGVDLAKSALVLE